MFQTIVHSGGITAAELSLDVGRSTISRQLSDLELRLGVNLCERDRVDSP
ncbi:MAG: LysR family transcriptional regulator [Chromatiales bacterium]|nr:LysR family transcriptional regulator [Chromatiales bacterium]